jgi:hypothetical protein
MIVCCGKYTVPTCVGCPGLPREYFVAPNMGWVCPKCGGSNAPSQPHCVLCPQPIPEVT